MTSYETSLNRCRERTAGASLTSDRFDPMQQLFVHSFAHSEISSIEPKKLQVLDFLQILLT